MKVEHAPHTAICAFSKCARTFTPHRRRKNLPWTKCCSRVCATHRSGELARARGMDRAHEGRRKAAIATIQEEIGELTTAAEAEAYRLGWRRGWHRGYHRGRKAASAA